MTYRSLTPTPANIPTSPATARSYTRITRPILTISGPRPKTEAEIAHAAARETALLNGAFKTRPAGVTYHNPRNPGPYGGKPKTRPQRPAFALDYSFQRRPVTE